MLFRIFLVSYLLTLVTELAVGRLFGAGRKDAALIVLVNLLTNPAVVYLYLIVGRFFPQITKYAAQLPLEAAAVAAEAYMYSSFAASGRTGIKRPVLYAISANAVSYSAGIILSLLKGAL